MLAACSGDAGKVFTADPGHNAFVRFVNAIPDSGSQDWKFIDAVEGSPTTTNMGFRGVFPGATYQAATAGTRHLRIFQSPLDQTYADPNLASPAIVSTVFVDSTFSLTEGQHYTLIAVGSLRAKTAKLVILNDNFTDPAGSVAVRIVNAGAGSSLDVYSSATGGTSALPATPLAGGLAAYAQTQWATMPTGALSLRALNAGSRTLPAMVDATAPAGIAADRALNLTAVGGTTIAGSVLTAFLFPAATTGSPATNSTFCTAKCVAAGAVFAVDRYPPSGF